MIKVLPILIDKLWGYEKWIYSPLANKHTTTEDGQITKKGPLVKIIQANQNLSIQVHPDDVLAKKLENEKNGKAECWFILDVANENQEIQVGLKEYDTKLLKKHIDQRTLGQVLNYIPIKIGDFIDVPAGLVHGICGGTTILEVQQPSDITYRLYDYNRKENGAYRELHIEKSLQAIKEKDWILKPTQSHPLTYQNKAATMVFGNEPIVPNEPGIVINLTTHETFICDKNEKITFSRFLYIPKQW